MIERLVNFIRQSRRVIMVASKPDKEEYTRSVKITALGIVIIGVIGFVVFLIVRLLGGI